MVTITFSLFFLSSVLNNEPVYSQQPVQNAQKMSLPLTQTPPPPSSSSKPLNQHGVKIMSPVTGKQVSVGKNLTISGISDAVGNKTSQCQVSVIVNNIKPYQQARGTGPGGAADYSKWNFVLTSKYATINPGPANKITAKYVCSNNPKASFYSVNVTGVAAAAINNATITKQQQQQQHPPKVTNTTSNDIYTTHQQTSITVGTATAIRNNITAASQPLGYDKVTYLDNVKLHGDYDKSKPIPHDTPFILPFP
jgi:hypothetical protein